MSLFFLSRESFQAIEDMTFERLAELEDELVKSMIDSNGLTYGDIELPREERLLKFWDDEARGVNDWLAENEPEEYTKRVTEFTRDVQQAEVI